MPEIRIAVWPSSRSNPAYHAGFYGALQTHGARVVLDGLGISDEELRRRRQQFDVLHIHWPEDLWRVRGPRVLDRLRGVVGLWRYLRLLRSMRVDLWWTVHNLAHHEGLQFVDRLGYAVLAHFARIIIVHSAVAGAALQRSYGVPSNKLVLIPIGNTIGTYPDRRERESIVRDFGLASGARTLLCFGLLRRYKGFDIAVRAFAGSRDTYQLIVAGPPGFDAAVVDELKALSAHHRHIHVVAERLDGQAVADLHHLADCVLLPYRSITTSSALLTALSFGRGVVTSDLPYFREVLRHEPSAVEFCDELSPAGLRDAVERFFKGDLNGREDAARRLAETYDWSQVILSLVGRLQNVRRDVGLPTAP